MIVLIQTTQLLKDHIMIMIAYLLVDTESGLKIVVANDCNFYNSDYAVQLVGTKEECKAEMKILNSY